MNDARYGGLLFRCDESVVDGLLATTSRLWIVVVTGESK